MVQRTSSLCAAIVKWHFHKSVMSLGRDEAVCTTEKRRIVEIAGTPQPAAHETPAMCLRFHRGMKIPEWLTVAVLASSCGGAMA
jgi:hypothetical protein